MTLSTQLMDMGYLGELPVTVAYYGDEGTYRVTRVTVEIDGSDVDITYLASQAEFFGALTEAIHDTFGYQAIEWNA